MKAMSMPFVLLMLLVLGASFTGAADVPVERMKRSTVKIHLRETLRGETVEGSGSGFWISNRHLVTNWHVCCSAETLADGRVRTEIWVELDGKGRVPVRVLWRSQRLDLAILQAAEAQDVPVVRFASFADIRDGAEVFAVGYPGASEEGVDKETLSQATMTRGVVSRIFKSAASGQQPVEKVQTDASISPGNSGGPLYNACGEVIGVNHAGRLRPYVTKRGDVVAIPTSGVNVAIHASQLLQPMQEHKIPVRLASGACSLEGDSLLSTLGGWAVQILTLCLAIAAVALAWNRRVRQNVSTGFATVTQRMRAYRGGMPPQPGWPHSAPPPSPVAPPPAPVVPAPTPAGPGAGPSGVLLAGLTGQYQGSRIGMNSAPLVFGRDPSVANVVFAPDCTQVSKRHCELRFDSQSGRFFLHDLWSANGTFLATGARLTPGAPVPLAPGQGFYLGDRRQEFQLQHAGSPGPAANFAPGGRQ